MKKNQPTFKQKTNRFLIFCAFLMLFALCIILLEIYKDTIKATQENTEKISSKIINEVEDTFLDIENISMSLMANQYVVDLLYEDEHLVYHAKVDSVKEELDSIFFHNEIIKNVLIYDAKGDFSRLRGELGNISAMRIYNLIEPMKGVQHINLLIENENHLIYITDIYDDGEQIGYFTFLMSEKDLTDYFLNFDYGYDIEILILAEDIVVASNVAEYVNKSTEEISSNLGVYNISKIGITPYEIIVNNRQAAINTLTNAVAYSLAAVVSFLIILIWINIFIKKYYFKPMISLIENTEKISNSNKALDYTGQADFDDMIEQINSMNIRIERHREKLHKTEIEKQIAVITSLKKQINAHFTINALNVVKRFSDIGRTEEVAKICDSLAFLIRYAHDGEQVINLTEEMFVLKKYTDIMSIRFPGKFEVTFDIADECCDVFLPRMLLQPIIENSIVHGFLGQENYRVEIKAFISEGDLLIEVRDNGVGIDSEQLGDIKNRLENISSERLDEQGLEKVALLNIQKRIVYWFGKDYGIDIISDKNGTVVSLRLPQ